jgi:hypothetical protein
MNIAGSNSHVLCDQRQGDTAVPSPASFQSDCEALQVLIDNISAVLDSQQCGLRPDRQSASASNDAAIAACLEAALAVMFKSLNDCERDKTVGEMTHSMVFVLIRAASGSHGVHLLQRFALMALAGICMSSSGRRLVLDESHPPVPALMAVLSGGERHSSALAALVLGNLALERAALVALDQCPAEFAREVVELMSSEQVSTLHALPSFCSVYRCVYSCRATDRLRSFRCRGCAQRGGQQRSQVPRFAAN